MMFINVFNEARSFKNTTFDTIRDPGRAGGQPAAGLLLRGYKMYYILFAVTNGETTNTSDVRTIRIRIESNQR